MGRRVLVICLFWIAGTDCPILLSGFAQGFATQSAEKAVSPESELLFRELLAQANLTPREVRFDSELFRYFFRTEGTSAFFDLAIREPLRLPYYAERLRNSLVGAVARPALAVENGAGSLGIATRRTLVGDPLESFRQQSKEEGAFEKAVLSVFQSAQAPVPPSVRQQLAEAVQKLPPLIQQESAFLILVAVHARQWRDRAFRELTPTEQESLFRLISQPLAKLNDELDGTRPDSQFPLLRKSLQKVDMPALMAGGHDCVLAVQQTIEALQKALRDETVRKELQRPFEVNIDTPWGRVRITGGGNDVHPRLPYLLLLDTGGDDAYYGGGANLSLENAVSFLLDLWGNDKYGDSASALRTPIAEQTDRAQRAGMAFGGALMGYAILADLSGDDLYRNAVSSMGSARFGVGMLLDLRGDDTYDGYAFTQGAGFAGIGVLIDREGKDTYACFHQGQGFGGIKGVGILLDATGDDTYTAHAKPVDFSSPQSAQHNASLAQGCGCGRRADYTDGHSLAGGVGILLDVQGNDRYLCGVFGQGAGYWGGVGLAIDLQGNDTREGVWYVQGASAHFAIGYLEDRLGNDSYIATMNMTMGAGHDFAIGFLLDADGDDTYSAPSLALGGANANGIGIFVDLKGNDTYRATTSSANFGRANPIGRGTLRERALALGLFLDAEGNDTYPPEIPFLGNGRSWLFWAVQSERPAESQVGVGLDR